MENPLNVWLFSTGKMVTDSRLQNVTHFMFDGGKLDISRDHETFQVLYTKYIKYNLFAYLSFLQSKSTSLMTKPFFNGINNELLSPILL